MTWLILTILFMVFIWGLRKFVFQSPPIIPQLIYGSLMISQLSYEGIVKLDRWVRTQYTERQVRPQLYDGAADWEFPDAPQVTDEEVWPDEWEVKQ